MPFPVGYEMPAREWVDLQEAVRLQAQADGVEGDFDAMLDLIRQGFNLLADRALRTRYLQHARRGELVAQEGEVDQNLTDVRDDIARLPPDPGPVPPR